MKPRPPNFGVHGSGNMACTTLVHDKLYNGGRGSESDMPSDPHSVVQNLYYNIPAFKIFLFPILCIKGWG